MNECVGTANLPDNTSTLAVNSIDANAVQQPPGTPPPAGSFPLPFSVQPFVTPRPAFTRPPSTPYQTVQGDPWDLISFKQFNNEYFSDQLMSFNANAMWNKIVNFDGNIVIQIPQVVVPVSVSAVVWGSTTRLT